MHAFEHQLNAVLGQSLLALYAVDCSRHLAWYRPASPWLAVVTDDVPLERIHAALYALRSSDQVVPVVVRIGKLQAYLTLNPMMQRCMRESAEKQTRTTFALPVAAALSTDQQAAHVALRLMEATPLLFPQMLTAAEQDKQTGTLDALASAFDIEPSAPATMIAAVHQAIAKHFNEAVSIPVAAYPHDSPTPFELYAVYEELDTAILVLPDSIAPQIATIDWATAAHIYQNRFRHLMVTTGAHLRLIAQFELTPAFFTGQYMLNWGHDVLESQPLSLNMVLRQVQRQIMLLQTNTLSMSCLGMDEPRLRHGLHVLQNQLLKIQLQYEVLCLHGVMALQRAPQWRYQVGDEPVARLKRVERHLAAWYKLYDEVLRTLGPELSTT